MKILQFTFNLMVILALTASVDGFAQSKLSEGCDIYNQLDLDRITTGIIGTHQFFAGEKIVAAANNPSDGLPTTVEFIVDNSLVDSDGFPGTVTHQFATDATFEVRLRVDSGAATWTVACFQPAPAKPIPTITWQGIIMLMVLLAGLAYYYHRKITA